MMDRMCFDAAIRRAITELPERFRAALQNVAIVVEAQPHRRRAGRSHCRLLGLYEGVPLPERTHEYAGVLPDKITLFQANIEAVCATEIELVAEIRKTLFHEIGHYFGLTERELYALGMG